MKETVKIRYRDFLKQKAMSLKPKAKNVFLAEFDPDNQDKRDEDRAKDLGMNKTAYIRQKTSMYQQLGFRAERHKREDFLRQLEKEFWESPSEQERKRLEIEQLNSLSQSLLLSHDQLGALVSAVKAGRKLQETEAPFDTRIHTLCRLWQAVYSVKERNRFQGHSGEITSISFSPNSQMLASASNDHTVELWRLDGTPMDTFQGHSGQITSISFSPDGETLASASADGTVKLWRLDGTVIQTFQGHSGGLVSISFSPDGKTIVSAGWDSVVKLWNLEGRELKTIKGPMNRSWGYRHRIWSVSFSPNGNTIAFAIDDNTVRLWHLDSNLKQTFKGHSGAVTSVCFSPNGQMLASASDDHTVKLWSLDGEVLQTFQGHSNRVSSVSFSPDGERIASASKDGTVILWKVNLEDLLVQACDWLRDYLKTNPNVSESDRYLCDGIGTQK